MLRLERDAFQRVPATGIDLSTLNYSASPPDEQPRLIRCIEHPTRRAFILTPPTRASDDTNMWHQYASPQLLRGGRWVLALCITKHRVEQNSKGSYEKTPERTKVAVVVWDLQALDALDALCARPESPADDDPNGETRTIRAVRLAPAAQMDIYHSCASQREIITQWDPHDKALNIAVAYTRTRDGLNGQDWDESSQQT